MPSISKDTSTSEDGGFPGADIATTENSQLSAPPVEQRMSYQSFAADQPFPSPQEFEFAKQLHDSIPPSPSTPITKSAIKSEGENLHMYTPTSATSPVPSSLSPCPLILRHPMHTFILPILCSACQNSRIHLIARFEAETIKESIHRETQKASQGGVLEDRKQIMRRSAQKGKLIPLICVEEGRIRRLEVRRSTLKDISAELAALEQNRVIQPASSMTLTDHPIDEDDAMPPKDLQQDASVETSTDERRRSSHVRVTSSGSVAADATQTSLAPTWSSWWNRSAGATPGMPATITNTSDNSARNTVHKRTNTMASESSRVSSPKIDWSSMQERWRGINNNVARDVFGRNVKGMNRIMGWDAERAGQESIKGVEA